MKSSNIKLPSGRICQPDLIWSELVSNMDTEELLKNIEDGVKEGVKLFIDEGYDILSSCQGHNPRESDTDTVSERYIKICIERTEIAKIIKNISDINIEYDTTLKIILNYDAYMHSELCRKEYREPVKLDISFGKYNNCEENYAIFVEHFNEYTW